MSEPRISTSEQLASYLKNTVSEKRYVHSLGVAQTAREVLDLFSCTDYTASWHGFDAPRFCGLVHDIAREMTDAQLLNYCRKNNVFLSSISQVSETLCSFLNNSFITILLTKKFSQ